ncbi:hypothetical protein HDV04_004922 [Boothiomyces sp. JEL0838]|nr:hypothetical protein HDV04_004907 [Boothiomyces sp. JEL0838]KAJ3310594.1 hypothetical protein HDV04_004922 [Boothiomyces sp. JEL0838]
MFESVWKSGECQGPPTSMSIYDETVVTSYLYTFASNDYILPMCGSNPVKIYSGCCGASLDLGLTMGYQSWSEQPVDTTTVANAPKSSNNHYYCALYPHSSFSLLNYTSIYALADGECTINGIKCYPNGTVQIYEQLECQGSYITSNLNIPQLISSTLLGNITGEYIKITDGTIAFTWVTYSPEIIEYTECFAVWLPIEYAAYVLMSVASLLSLIRAVYFSVQYTKHKRNLDLYRAVNTGLWFLWVVFNFLYYTVMFSTNEGWMILAQLLYFVFNAATYMTAAGTLMFFLEIQRKEKHYTLGLVILFVYQLVTGGSNYLAYFKWVDATSLFFDYWAYLNPVWIVSVYLFDTFPQLILVYSLIRARRRGKTTLFQEFMIFLNQNYIYSTLVFLHFCNMICFYTIMYLTSYSELLGNDRVYLAMCGPLTMVDTLHSILNSSILSELKLILEAKIKKRQVPSLKERFDKFFSKDSRSSVTALQDTIHTSTATKKINHDVSVSRPTVINS